MGCRSEPRATGRVTGTVLGRNLALRSSDDWIDVESPLTTLTRNLALHNTDLGIEAVPGVTDGGGNRARGNGNPAQCAGVACHEAGFAREAGEGFRPPARSELGDDVAAVADLAPSRGSASGGAASAPPAIARVVDAGGDQRGTEVDGLLGGPALAVDGRRGRLDRQPGLRRK